MRRLYPEREASSQAFGFERQLRVTPSGFETGKVKNLRPSPLALL
jgi:hypothetical protein